MNNKLKQGNVPSTPNICAAQKPNQIKLIHGSQFPHKFEVENFFLLLFPTFYKPMERCIHTAVSE